MMTKNAHGSKDPAARKGSILLLVVGMLAMVAMLGATYLIVTRLNTRQVQQSAIKNQANPVAAGVLATVSEMLARRLYIGDAGPYTLAYTRYDNTPTSTVTSYGPDAWKMYITYPDSTMERGLATWQNVNGSWLWATNCQAWTAGNSYYPGNVVSYSGAYYYCLTPMVNDNVAPAPVRTGPPARRSTPATTA